MEPSASTSGSPVLGESGHDRCSATMAIKFSRALLAAMLAFSDGDFAVRLPADLTGVERQDRRRVQRHRRRQRAARARNRARLPRGRQGRQAQAAHDACPARSAAGPTRSPRSTR